MPFRIVQSRQNTRLKQLRKALSAPIREPGSLAGIEGPNLLGEALRAGLRIPAVFVAQGSEHLLEQLHFAAGTELLSLPRDLLAPVVSTETPQPVAALVEPPDWTWRDLLQGLNQPGVPLILVLAGLQDPGNLGTVVRSAEAFGATGAVSLPGTVSAWNPKAVRASAGSVFRLPLLATGEQECFTQLRQAGLRILTTAAVAPSAPAPPAPPAVPAARALSTAPALPSARGSERPGSMSGHDFSRAEKRPEIGRALAPAEPEPAHLAHLTGPVAILIGNEGNGVPPALAAQADGAITIPCPGPVESLNAAVAAGILLYEASRQRSKCKSTEPIHAAIPGARR
jgi:RNA methyltransferase, TrmH family